MIEGLTPPAELDDRPELIVCPEPGCGKDNVAPIDDESFDANHHWVLCRCPDCGWSGHGVYSSGQWLDLLEELTEARTDIERAVLKMRKADLENMEDQISVLVRACDLDLIYPSDIAGQTLI